MGVCARRPIKGDSTYDLLVVPLGDRTLDARIARPLQAAGQGDRR
jgi:hypothetical protein